MGGAAQQGGDRIDDRLLALLAEHAATGAPCVLATVVRCAAPTSAHPGDAAVITADGALTGWIGGSCAEPLVRREALRAIADGQPRLVRIVPADAAEEVRAPAELTVATTCPSGGALDIFVDPQLPRPLLLVLGASAAARALVALGGHSGFRTCAAYPGAQSDDLPGADRVLSSFDLTPAQPGADTWAVVATMGHNDEDALAAVLGHPDVDVALVASVPRAAAVLENLRRRGVDEAGLRRVRTPAGGQRGGRQEHIALFALAEIVTLRNRRAGASRPRSGMLDAPADTFATDPVCAMAVDLSTDHPSLLHDGVVLHFCGAACRERFLAEPVRFAVSRFG